MTLDPQAATLAKPKRILLAEDNSADVVLFELAFAHHNFPIEIEPIVSGDILLSRLRELAGRQDHGLSLVVLDANLPVLSAEEVLTIVTQQASKIEIPLVVLSSYLPQPRRDRLESLGVQKIFIKPFDFTGYLHLAADVFSLCHSSSSSAQDGCESN